MSYKPIPEFDKSLLNYCEEYIHRASQFLAMLGKNYLEDQPDDSNANIEFDSSSASILSREIESEISLSLNIPNWKFEMMKGGKKQSEKALTGMTKQSLFEWLRDQLLDQGINGEKLKFIDHYEVPDHVIDHGQAFPEMIPTTIDKWVIMRANAQVLLKDLNRIVGVTSDIRIWPHHFDTGTYYPFGESKAIGSGWAIADTLVDNPYLYIYGWNADKEINYDAKPELPIGKWLITDNWQGAILESSELSMAEDQYKLAGSFMKTAIEFIKPQLT